MNGWAVELTVPGDQRDPGPWLVHEVVGSFEEVAELVGRHKAVEVRAIQISGKPVAAAVFQAAVSERGRL